MPKKGISKSHAKKIEARERLERARDALNAADLAHLCAPLLPTWKTVAKHIATAQQLHDEYVAFMGAHRYLQLEGSHKIVYYDNDGALGTIALNEYAKQFRLATCKKHNCVVQAELERLRKEAPDLTVVDAHAQVCMARTELADAAPK
jgi:hypothetical protein